MFCKECGSELKADSKFCTNCGSPVENAVKVCKNCGTPLKAEDKFCQNCGAIVSGYGSSYKNHNSSFAHGDNVYSRKNANYPNANTRNFPTNQRIGRLRFFLFYIAIIFYNLIMNIILGCAGDDVAILVFLLCIPALIFGIIIQVKRWHDLNYSGWYCLLNIVPLVNFIVIFYLCLKKGTDGPNKYGIRVD